MGGRGASPGPPLPSAAALLLLLLLPLEASAARSSAPPRFISLPGPGALDGLTPAESTCKVPISPAGGAAAAATAAFAERVNAWRREYGDAAAWTAAVLKRVKKREKHASQGRAFEPVAREDDAEDAAFGAYLSGIDLLKQQVEAEGNQWHERLHHFSAKSRFEYKIAFVGYGEGESFRKLYARLESTVKSFGKADGVEFWDKRKLLRHGGVNATALARLFEADPKNGAWQGRLSLVTLVLHPFSAHQLNLTAPP